MTQNQPKNQNNDPTFFTLQSELTETDHASKFLKHFGLHGAIGGVFQSASHFLNNKNKEARNICKACGAEHGHNSQIASNSLGDKFSTGTAIGALTGSLHWLVDTGMMAQKHAIAYRSHHRRVAKKLKGVGTLEKGNNLLDHF